MYEALETALGICEGLGFRTKLDDEGYYGYAEIGAGEELMGILVHLDVVPPGSGWSHDLYGCEIAEGKLFGRGVVDDKGPAVAVMYAMKDILDSALVLDKRVRLILASQEEDGPWADIARYKAQEEIPGFGFTPDASFPATFGEKGILAVALSMPAERAGFREIQGGTATNMVADQAQAVLMDGTVLETRGRSAHGSMPELGDNAITSLMTQAAAHDCPFAQFYMDHIGHALNGEGLGIALEDRASGGLTLNVGKIGLAEGRVTMHLDIRYPVTFSPQDVLAPLEGVCAAHGLTLVKEDWMASGVYGCQRPGDHRACGSISRGDRQRHAADGHGRWSTSSPSGRFSHGGRAPSTLPMSTFMWKISKKYVKFIDWLLKNWPAIVQL